MRKLVTVPRMLNSRRAFAVAISTSLLAAAAAPFTRGDVYNLKVVTDANPD